MSMAVDVAEFDQQWQKVASHSFTFEDTVFVPHDFAVSESYYIFSHSATSFDMVCTASIAAALAVHPAVNACCLCLSA